MPPSPSCLSSRQPRLHLPAGRGWHHPFELRAPPVTCSQSTSRSPNRRMNRRALLSLPFPARILTQPLRLPPPQNHDLGWGAACVFRRNLLQVSTSRGAVVCPACRRSSFERGNGQCPGCQNSLGFTYLELLPGSSDSQGLVPSRAEVGTLIRRLRSRRGMTQAVLASLTGINRTYISRAERGQVLPSIIVLTRIAGAMGVDKFLLRVRSPI